jgi:membrane protein involved in colicin uptake
VADDAAKTLDADKAAADKAAADKAAADKAAADKAAADKAVADKAAADKAAADKAAADKAAAGKAEDVEVFDEPTASPVLTPRAGAEYDPRIHEDKARRRIAYSLIALFTFAIVAIFLLVSYSAIKVEEMKEFAVILGPLVTLVSAATGFYYGTKQTNNRP